jgi:hypothetical protein
MMWVFTFDDFFQWFRSDSLVLSGSFRVVNGESSFSNQMVYRLWIDGAPIGFALTLVGSDTLRAIEECLDCYTLTFGRQQ